MTKVGKRILLFATIALTLFTLHTTALIPYTRSPLWDTLIPFEDPFRVIEQTPLNIQKPTLDNALALARADWKETPKEHIITLDVPGIKKDAVKIEVEENRVLRVSGERKSEEEDQSEGDKWHRVERINGKFWRQFRMHGNVDLEKVKAKLENGVLRIVVPKVSDGMRKPSRVIDIVEEEGKNDGKGGEDVIKASKADM